MATTNLNNPEAFRFLNLHMVPTVISSMEAAGFKGVKTSSPKKGEIADVTVKYKNNGILTDANVTIYYGNGQLGISQHKMTWAKNILTAVDNKIYIINIDKLRAAWSNPQIATIANRTYRDGLGEASNMTRFKIDYIVSNANIVIDIPADLYTDFSEKLKMVQTK